MRSLQRPFSPFDAHFLKGGPGSGNFGHAGRPGEVGGSSSGGGGPAGGRKIEAEIRERSSAVDVGRADDKPYLERLQKAHGLKVSTSSDKVDKFTMLGVHEGLAGMPTGARQYLKERGVSVRVVHKDDVPVEKFSVGGTEFTKGGHADYRNGEIVIWDQESYGGANNLITHEAGHFVVEGALRYAAAGDDVENALSEVKDQIRTFPGERQDADGRDVPQLAGLKTTRESLDRVYAPYMAAKTAIHNFSDSTMKEGGYTNYAHSYVLDQKVGGGVDIVEYRPSSPMSTFTPGHAFAAITRAANENFAEIFSAVTRRGGKDAYAVLAGLKTSSPKTYKAFRELQRTFMNKKFKYIAEAKFV